MANQEQELNELNPDSAAGTTGSAAAMNSTPPSESNAPESGVPGVSGISDDEGGLNVPSDTTTPLGETHAPLAAANLSPNREAGEVVNVDVSITGDETHGKKGARANPRKHKKVRAEDEVSRPTMPKDQGVFTWDEDRQPAENLSQLGARLAAGGNLYRAAHSGGGLIYVSADGADPVIPINTLNVLRSFIVDRCPLEMRKDGKCHSRLLPDKYARLMLGCEAFLGNFQVVDEVTEVPEYLLDYSLAVPGYNDGGPDWRILYRGSTPQVAGTFETVAAFLDAMPFAMNADRTNALAFALTVLLAPFWPGAKPVFPITSTKSHGGKDTTVRFAGGVYPVTSVSYQSADWPIQHSIVGAIKQNPAVRVICIENARTRPGERIASAFLERIVTDRRPFLISPGLGEPLPVTNRFVFAITTNFGTISEDLMNRACPVHLAPCGSIEDRQSPIGNPKLEFLPQHVGQIDAELRGMVAKWREAGQPLDTSAKHPCIGWAQTIGGILKVNGFTDFLGNYARQRSSDEPLRRSLGRLGAIRPNEWLTATMWAELCEDQGHSSVLIPSADRATAAGRARGIGTVLSNHREERFHTETEDNVLELVLQKSRSRFDEKKEKVSTRYRFEVLRSEEVPVDPE